MAGETCEVCGQKDFTAEGGFFYCVECGTKSRTHGQQLVEEFDTEAVNQGVRGIKLKVENKILMITSYEQINYILLAFTERLISFGAGENLKLTVLQMWTSYLRRMEIAFFDKEKPEKPRLSAFFLPIDAAIIYSRKLPRAPKRPRRASTGPSQTSEGEMSETQSLASRRILNRRSRANQRRLLNAEHDSFLSDQQSDVNRSLHEMSVRSLNTSQQSGEESDASSRSSLLSANGGPKVRFSRLARVRMKRKMKLSSRYIDKLEQDTDWKVIQQSKQKGGVRGTLKRKGNVELGDPENLVPLVIYGLLGLALNVSGSEVQLADVVRFIREDHLSNDNLIQYLPQEIDPTCYASTLPRLQKTPVTSHTTLRNSAFKFAEMIHATPVMPNLAKLCLRYLQELQLPLELHGYINNLMDWFHPVMKRSSSCMPNYEGRAMAFILFALKLLFGLNDNTEVRISSSVADLNRLNAQTGNQTKTAFVFTEWLEYIEARKVIISQVYYPVNRLTATDDNVAPDPGLFISFNSKKINPTDATKPTTSDKSRREHLTRLKDITSTIIQTYYKPNRTKPTTSIDFEPSLTPYRSYLETIMLAQKNDSSIHIPEFMSVDHTDRTIEPLINISEFRRLLQENCRIKLRARKLKSNLESFHFIKPLTNVSSQVIDDFYKVHVNCTETDWCPLDKSQNPAPTSNEILDEIVVRNEIDRQYTALQKPKSSDGIATKLAKLDESIAASESMFSDTASFMYYPYQQSPIETANLPLRHHTLLVPNYDYWVRPINRPEQAAATLNCCCLPDNFYLVLNECARVVENSPLVIYQELIVLEDYFFYAVQPPERWCEMADPCAARKNIFRENSNIGDRSTTMRVVNSVSKY
ncbi:TATA box-binding protein-associated factor RNA polymerase I subunit B [Uranotaenia lowii]|uniref:TATA box-binding protein-associated factor RNA polymerase I subunit B n=1 Tax=Uranotaenia lowii TaxID=190385 RepID=UPI002478711E|nr:TATA box-binding protein-associated factor RNA polymerase I subunit B [Uranotaenia lowii]XP_055588047.1 TATA box-binding protein-associated factor RNA polymerase I subunit B [Uranotaenia lowii]